MLPHINYATSPARAARLEGKICPKGQAGIQSLYDPYRIVKVLKRTGTRGSNRSQTIPFDQAIDEIVNGGFLFKHVKGEENRRITGLRDIFVVRDAALMNALREDAQKVVRKQMSVKEFQEKHAPHLDKLIDPNYPDLGPLNNQFVFQAGRIEHGRKEFSQRWLKDAFGSVNWYEHTTICEQSHHIAYQQITNQYSDGKWSGGKTHMKPDGLNARFIIFFGTGAFEANFGPPSMAQKITEGIVRGRLRIAVVDPRFSKTAAKAQTWIPIKPGGDGAFALGMIRWIIANKRYDENFLTNANKVAAKISGEYSWSTATYLVKLDEAGRPGNYLRAAEIGLGDEHTFVVLKDAKPLACKPYDEETAVQEDLAVDTTLNGIRVKSAFQLLWESASSGTIAQWAEIAGADESMVINLAREVTAYGKQAAVEFYRGPVQHTNGYYNAQALIALNLLVGNVDWKGDVTTGGGHWHEYGDNPGNPFNMKKLHAGKLGSFGLKLTREGTAYEATTLFKEYPAPRPFYPFTSNVYQKVLPSARMGYPYRIKALILHMGTPALSVPAAQAQIDALTDLEAVPLLISSDIVIGDTSVYADYVFPDLSIWERWGTPHPTPDVVTKTSKVRQPIVAPLTETVMIFGEKMPLCMETLMLAIAEKLNLPGYGKDGFAPGMDFLRMEDFYLKLAANIAMGDKEGEEVPEAGLDEMKLFVNARRHLPETVFHPARWEKAVGSDKWKQVVYVLNRGGRYEDFQNAYEMNYVKHRFANIMSLYVEPVATTRNSISGEFFSGVPVYEPVRDFSGKEVLQKGYALHLITYKDILGGQSRTLPNDYWLSAILPENYVLMNRQDAFELGLRDGSLAKIVSASNPSGEWDLKNGIKKPLVGKVKVVEGIRPGTVAVSWHFGYWAYGSADTAVDGHLIKGDQRRRTGLCPNSAMMADPYLKDVCLTDPIGGSSSFFDTLVNVTKI